MDEYDIQNYTDDSSKEEVFRDQVYRKINSKHTD